MALLDNIKQICKEKGLTIFDLEKQAGLSENSVFAWKKTKPSVDKVKRVSDVLGVTMEELLK